MGLETSTYIDSLDKLWPLGTDKKWHGDNHFRNLKNAILATFPNITGALTPTHTELNYVDGVTSPIQTQLNSKFPYAGGSLTGRATPVSAVNASASGTVAWDISVKQDFTITLTGNVDGFTITNLPPRGTHLALVVVQDGTGGWTVTWGTSFHWEGGTPVVVTATAGAVDLFYFRSNGTVLQNIGYFQEVKE